MVGRYAAGTATGPTTPSRALARRGRDVRSVFSGLLGPRGRVPRRRRTRRRRRRLLAAIVLAAVGVIALTVVLLAQKSDREARDRADLAQAVMVERARLRRIQAPHTGAARSLVPRPAPAPPCGGLRAPSSSASSRRRSRADARARARAGELDGPIVGTECGPDRAAPRRGPRRPGPQQSIGRYDCVAVKSDVQQGGRSVARLGHPFVAALDFRRFTFVYCRNTPPQSERGTVLVSVRLDRRCLAATGAALGSGYVDDSSPP